VRSSSSIVSSGDDERRLEAGDGVGLLRSTTHASILCETGQIKCIRGSAETRGRDRYHERAAKTSSVVGIMRVCPQIRRAPTRNPVALAMSCSRIGKGVGGGGGGDYIAAEGALIRQGLNGNNGGVTAAVSGEIDGQRLKTTPHCHVGPAVSEREGGDGGTGSV
jgi:hypothetical protein